MRVLELNIHIFTNKNLIKMLINLKRVYETHDETDGFRVLSDRLWPRGIKKEELDFDFWAKEIAPSTLLRKTYHQTQDFDTFSSDYQNELEQNTTIDAFLELVHDKKVLTLLTAAKEIEKCHLPILKSFLLTKLPN